MNPRYGDLDPYHMAASAIDEAVRELRRGGRRSAPHRHPRQLLLGLHRPPRNPGSLVRAALACHDIAIALGTPFISGKDSLNNEFSYDATGRRDDLDSRRRC